MIWITAETATHPIPWILRRTAPRIPAVTPARTVPRTVLRTAAAIPAGTKRRTPAAIPVRIRPRTPAGTTWITAAEINRLRDRQSETKNRTRKSGSADVLQMRPLIFFFIKMLWQKCIVFYLKIVKSAESERNTRKNGKLELTLKI